jgi:hypothetical protein
VSLHDDLVPVVSEPVEGALGEDRVIKKRDPLLDRAVEGHDGQSAAVPLDDEESREKVDQARENLHCQRAQTGVPLTLSASLPFVSSLLTAPANAACPVAGQVRPRADDADSHLEIAKRPGDSPSEHPLPSQ